MDYAKTVKKALSTIAGSDDILSENELTDRLDGETLMFFSKKNDKCNENPPFVFSNGSKEKTYAMLIGNDFCVSGDFKYFHTGEDKVVRVVLKNCEFYSESPESFKLVDFQDGVSMDTLRNVQNLLNEIKDKGKVKLDYDVIGVPEKMIGIVDPRNGE